MTRNLWLLYGALAVISYAWLVTLITTDSVVVSMIGSAVAVLVISPGGMAAVGGCEERSLKDMFNPTKQAYAFLFGDTLVLPAGVALLAYIYSVTHMAAVHLPVWWWWVSLLIGGVGGYAFHVWDSANYRKGGHGAAAKSAGKVYHDIVVYPALLGGIVYAGLPLIRWGAFSSDYAMPFVGVLCLLVVWAALGAIDGRRAAELSPWGHVEAARTNLDKHPVEAPS